MKLAKRKEARDLTPEETRQAMLRGVSSEAAIFLYDQAMMALEVREQADFMAALQMRDAVQWTVVIDDMQEELRRQVASSEPDDKRIAAIIKNKQAAEDARRRILDGLLLTPQKKRGRPEEPKPQRGGDDPSAADDAWEAFDQAGSGADGL